MRRLSFDQYEFDPPDSEQALDLAISYLGRHRGLEVFLDECGVSRTRLPLPPNWARWSAAAEHLRAFAGIELPQPSKWREAVLLCDEWNDLELGIAIDSLLIWYHWSTSA